jgi:hypothetical protein
MNDWDGGGMDNNLSDVVAAVNNDIDDFSDTLSGKLGMATVG